MSVELAIDAASKRLRLPYMARIARWRLAMGLVAAPACVILVTAKCWDIAVSFESASGGEMRAFVAFAQLASGSAAILFVVDLFRFGLLAAMHRGYHFGFDDQKLWHFQLVDPIELRNVRKLRIRYLKLRPISLRLTVAQPIALRFRTLLNCRRVQSARTDRAQFMTLMTGDDALLEAEALAELVARHGAIVERKGRAPAAPATPSGCSPCGGPSGVF